MMGFNPQQQGMDAQRWQLPDDVLKRIAMMLRDTGFASGAFSRLFGQSMAGRMGGFGGSGGGNNGGSDGGGGGGGNNENEPPV